MTEGRAWVVRHDVPSPCGKDDEHCHNFPAESPTKLRYVFLCFHGIKDSHYVGINRVRMYGAFGEISYRVISADRCEDKADDATSVTKAGGWWASVGDTHSLCLELDEEEQLVSVCLWCANTGATPQEIEICDAVEEEAELCAKRESLRPTCTVFDVTCTPAAPAVHKVPQSCGKGDNECRSFEINCTSCVSYLLIKFSGIHDSFYIGVNRLKLFRIDGTELPYKVVAADGSACGAMGCCVDKDGNWWATCGDEHSILLKLEQDECVARLGLWCANAGATPRAMQIVQDFKWVQELIQIFQDVAKHTDVALGRRTRQLIAENTSLLSGLADSDETLRDALLLPVFTGAQLQFPLQKHDALGRLRAQVLCDMSIALNLSLADRFKTRFIPGVEWQDYQCLGDLPDIGDFEFAITSALVQESEAHADEWLGTRLYVPPGGRIRVCANGIDEGWRVRVGAHIDDITSHDNWPRWPRVSLDAPLLSGITVDLFTPFGGLLYLTRSCKASRSAQVSCSGNLVLQPVVSIAEGVDVAGINSSCGGWVDCEGKNVILTVPVQSVRDAIAGGADIIAALNFYDSLWTHYNALSPRHDPRPQRIVPDLEISNGWMHSGYPIMTHYGEMIDRSPSHPIPRVFDVERVKKEGNWGLFHEMGHNMQRPSWTFEGTVEVTVNLFTMYGFQQLVSKETTNQKFAEHTAVPEVFFQDGSPRHQWNSDPFLALRTYLQVIMTFGWGPLSRTFKMYANEGEISRDYRKQVRDFVKTWSLEIGRDIRPHWRLWGFTQELEEPDDDLSKLKPWAFEEIMASQ